MIGGGLVLAAVIVGWLSTRIALERIERAEAIEMQPMKHGGWGYRGSIRVFGRAAVVLRAGDGLQLELTGGKKFAITVDDADTAAGTLKGLVAAKSDAMSGRHR